MNISTLLGVEFRPITIPESIHARDAADFVAMVDVRNRVYREISGHDDHTITADELIPLYRADEYERRFLWLVVRDGAPVGRVGVDVPLEEGSKTAFWLIELLSAASRTWPRHGRVRARRADRARARPHRAAVVGRASRRFRSRDRPAHRVRLDPQDRAARFYEANGYALEQVERVSALDLQAPTDTLETPARRGPGRFDGLPGRAVVAAHAG